MTLREAARLLVRITTAEEWPAQRLTPEGVDNLLSGPDYQAEERFRQRLAASYV